jgi:ribonucleoside-diphosphate reductase beta chain
MKMIECEELFEVDKEILKHTEWFDVEISSDTHADFFNKTPTNYNKKSISITTEDLF